MSGLSPVGPLRRRTPRRAAGALRVVLETVVMSLGAGLLVGAVWSLVAPDAGPGAAVVAEGQFAADGWFAIVAAAAGALLAAVLCARHDQRPLVALSGLVAGGVLGSLAAWWCGMLIGPDRLGLGAIGVLLAWPIAATLVLLAVTALADRADGRVEATDDALISSVGRPQPSSPP